MQELHEKESTAGSLLAIAIHGLKEGRILHAKVIAKGLVKQDISRKGDARIIEALASTRMLPDSVYQKARQKFQSIIEDSDFQEPTCPRASALVGLAWAEIALGDYEQATTALEEAARIYTTQGSKELGIVIDLQGLVYAWNGELGEALKCFVKGKKYSQIDTAGAMHSMFDFFESQFVPEGVDDASLMALVDSTV